MSNGTYLKCVICGGPTATWCLVCKQPLHRMPGPGPAGCHKAHEGKCRGVAH